MKHITILGFLLVVLTTMVSAQKPSPDKFEEIKAHRVAYITERLNLTIKEAQEFWPLYNDYYDKVRKLKDRNYIKEEDLTDENARLFLHSKLEKEDEISQLKSDFYTRISKLISYKRIYLLEKAEYEFKHKLLDRYKKSK